MTSSICCIVELSSRSQSANIQCKCVRFLASEIILVAAWWFVNSVLADQNPHPSRCLSLLVTLQLRFPDLWRVWDSPCGGGLVDLWRAPTEPESRLHSSDPAKLETLIQGTLRLTVGGQDGAPASRIHQTSEPGETEPGRPLCDL